MEKRNKVYLDFIRIIAIFLVVVNHTGAFRFPDCPGWLNIGYWCQMIWNDIVKMAVPMFFMVSGALLLPKEETIVELFKKRILMVVQSPWMTLTRGILTQTQAERFCLDDGHVRVFAV